MTVLEEFMRVESRQDEIEQFTASVDVIDDQVMTIVGFIELALLRAGDDADLRADLAEIRDAAVRAVEKTAHLRARRAKVH